METLKVGQQVEVLRQVQPERWSKAWVRVPDSKLGTIVEWRDENGKVYMTTAENEKHIRMVK